MPLTLAEINIELQIIKLLCDEKEKRYLESLGISVGQTLTVIKNNGEIICKVKDSRIGLDEKTATKIIVK